MSKKLTVLAIKDNAAKWLQGLGEKGLVIDEKLKEGFVGEKVVGCNSTYYVLSKEGWFVTLGFDGQFDKNSTLKQLKSGFKYIALDRLPTPGLDQGGWNIRPQTPISSFKDGVEIVDFKDGKITLHVKTKFFALYGNDPSVIVPADAPSPEGSYFQIRKSFPLDLKLVAPFDMGK